MENRRQGQKHEKNAGVLQEPDPAPLLPNCPIPIPWISAESTSAAADAPLHARVAVMPGSYANAATLSESLLQPNLLEVSRHAAVELGSSVLLVDDNHHHRKRLLAALRDQGHNVLYAADGVAGEAVCRTSQCEIGALIACADMKRMCGFELARRVGRTRPDIRVLLMWRHFEGSEAANRAHARGYAVIEEPFTAEELCSRLTGLLASPRNDACGASRRDDEDRLISPKDEVFATSFKNEN